MKNLKPVFVNESDISMPKKFLTQWIGLVLSELKKNPKTKQRMKILPPQIQELTLVFLNLNSAKKMNYYYRNKNYPTDVLSFSSSTAESLGDLVLCPQVIRKQSLEHKVLFREELAYMVLHGILHLLGYDHEKSPNEARVMFQIQDEIYNKINFTSSEQRSLP